MEEEKKETNENDEGKKYSKGTYVILIAIVVLIVVIIGIVGYGVSKINGNTNNDKASMENSTRSNNNLNENSNNRPGINLRENITFKKPIIYIYPTEETEVEVKLGNPQYLSCTYPKYEESWKVVAKPNGDLKEIKTGRNLYALYWEGENIPKNTNLEEGFCIKGEDTASFLEEKLSTLGLSDREAEEFIVYWLPKMEDNKYNYIRFETKEEQNEAMPLEVTPKPDNIIRVMMDWKALDNNIEVKEQKLATPSRDGYTVVEWGGSELK